MPLNELKQSISAQSAYNQQYLDGLAWAHQEVFKQPTNLFKKEFYLLCANQIDENRPRIWTELFPLAESVVKSEKLFKEILLTTSSIEGFRDFYEKYTCFANEYFRKLKNEQCDAPFFFKKEFPHSVSWFESVVGELSKEKPGFHEQLQNSDPEALDLIFQIAILKGIKETDSVLPEIFEEKKEELEAMKKLYLALSPEEQTQLRATLMRAATMNPNGSEHELFIKMGKFKAELESAKREFCNKLLHTLSIENHYK